MLRKAYDWVIKLSHGRFALPTMVGVAFAEASFFPLPPDIILAPMVLARRDRAWFYALLCTLGSVVGGMFGYAIGYFLQPVGLLILKLFGQSQGLAAYQAWFAQNGFLVILIKGLTPIPYKLVTIASGLAKFDLIQFVIASVITRGARFFIVAALLQHPAAKAFVDKHLTTIVVVAVALAIAAFVLVKLIH